MTAAKYIGRFAPTPSGPLHLGSLLAATASWLDARAHHGSWRLRLDDLDAPRTAPGAEAAILATLEAHGLRWDGAIERQSDRIERYRDALDVLTSRCYACRCTRKELRDAAVYPGTCRDRKLSWHGNAVRIRIDEHLARQAFDDRVQGRYRQDLVASGGDFIVWRRDGFASYPLAVVVDDAAMGVTHVLRGADLLDNTPRQLFLMACLGLPPPVYGHLPVIAEASGVKLSKHNLATAIDDGNARLNLAAVLGLLGLAPPQQDVDGMLGWAIPRWDLSRARRGLVWPDFVALA